LLIYLDHAFEKWRDRGEMQSRRHLIGAIIEGAVERVRPKMMTVMAIMAGLLPI
jgi:Cu(I)/Ag(I) efflux system membrane protein CusA/SilA